MNLQEKEKQLCKLMQDWEDAQELVMRISTEANALRQAINEEKLDEHFKDGTSIETVMALDWNLVDSTTWWHKLDEWFRTKYPSVYRTGMWVESNQPALQVQFDQNHPYETQLHILEFVPFLRPMADGCKRIGIFEHTLSEHGVWALSLKPDGSVELLRNRWSQATFKTLDEALRHVYDYHPYELRKE